jgi:predicted AlkP superfamily pyrophosphatase or phosphodiesterase
VNVRELVFLVSATCLTMPLVAEPLLVISIDGLHPGYVIDADRHGVSIPTLRSFVREGAYASGVIGVVPTVTFPSHTTLVTGVSPAEHGIVANTPFDPRHTNREGWYWYAEDVRVPTLWSAAKARGLTTAGVNWSVTVGDTSIDYLIPELWRAVNDEDVKLLRAVSRPEGVLARLERDLGPYVNGYEDTVEADVIRTRFSAALLREHRPTFMAVHLIALDGFEHREGPYTAPVFATLEALDAMIGELSAAALANDPETVVAIVSDHGFFATHTSVNLRVPFVAAGLIELAGPIEPGVAPSISSWQAQLIPSGGSAAVILRDRADDSVRAKVRALLTDIARNRDNGIERVVERADIERAGGFPDADFLVEFAPGYYSGTALAGDLLTPATSRGTHGYRPDHPEMHAALFLKGRGIAKQALGVVDMRAIAPTFAEILGVELSSAKVTALEVARSAAPRVAAAP